MTGMDLGSSFNTKLAGILHAASSENPYKDLCSTSNHGVRAELVVDDIPLTGAALADSDGVAQPLKQWMSRQFQQIWVVWLLGPK